MSIKVSELIERVKEIDPLAYHWMLEYYKDVLNEDYSREYCLESDFLLYTINGISIPWKDRPQGLTFWRKVSAEYRQAYRGSLI